MTQLAPELGITQKSAWFLTGSAADYPVRVPSLACIAVVFAATLYRRRLTA